MSTRLTILILLVIVLVVFMVNLNARYNTGVFHAEEAYISLQKVTGPGIEEYQAHWTVEEARNNPDTSDEVESYAVENDVTNQTANENPVEVREIVELNDDPKNVAIFSWTGHSLQDVPEIPDPGPPENGPGWFTSPKKETQDSAHSVRKSWTVKNIPQLWEELAEPGNLDIIARVMDQRLSLVRRWCRLQELTGHSTTIKPKAFHHFSEFNLGWCPIYKAGSSNWKKYLSKLTGIDKECAMYKKVGMHGSCLHNHLQKFNKPGAKSAPDSVKFLVVRHPYERVVSAFRDKIEQADKLVYYNSVGRLAKLRYRPIPRNTTEAEKDAYIARSDKLVKSRGQASDPTNPYENPPGPTFLEFSKAVLYDGKKDMHWAVFEQWCAPCHVAYSAVVKFETLNIDNLFVLRKSGLNVTGFEGHSNPTSAGGTREATWKTYFRMLDRELLGRYKERYTVDCEMFGYDCDVSQFY